MNDAKLTLKVVGAPTVTGVTPADGATGVAATDNVTATFSEAMDATTGDGDPSTITSSTFKLVKDGTSTALNAEVTYNSTTNTATLNPNADLDPGTKYNATVVSGANGVQTPSGITLAQDKTWSFTTLNPNSAPSTPGTPGLAEGSSTPNQGGFTLNWGASTDDGKPAGSSVTYTLQHKDANDAEFTNVAGATNLSTNSYTFGGSNAAEAEGTWTYRVQASDGSLSSASSAASGAVKVDKTGPSAPTAATNPASPYYSGTSGDWFKNSVIVSYSGGTDPLLADGSAGSGVDGTSYSASQTFNTSGSHNYSGTVKDNVGNISTAAASGSVKVDATNPLVSIDSGCPTGVVGYNSSHSISVSASDDHSGLKTDPTNAALALDTSLRGPQSKVVTATDNVDRSAQATCEYTVNRAPSNPGAPVLASTSTSPNQGAFTLNWDASTDLDGNFSHYVLQHKNSAANAQFTDVAGATNLSTNSYTFPAASKEAEGTWTYRVKAVDAFEDSQYATSAANLAKVDQSRPNAPVANEGIPDYTAPNGDKWFKNSATVSFTANGDPNLADGSLGSGVASVSAPQSRSTTGALSYSGTATDNVGLVSLITSGIVNVDATAPVANITCPSTSAILGSSASASWTASDGLIGSGLATAANGSVALDTSAIASKTATAPTATDNVGLQSALATCNYSVAAAFNGFYQPIDGHLVNAGKVGRVYPVKWQLKNADNILISDELGTALAASMTVTQRTVNCTTGDVDVLETEAGTAGSTSVRYDATSDQFIFNYKAPSTSGCYNLNVNKADGINTQTIQFKFAK